MSVKYNEKKRTHEIPAQFLKPYNNASSSKNPIILKQNICKQTLSTPFWKCQSFFMGQRL